MRKRYLIVYYLLFTFCITLYSQEKKSVTINKTNTPPKIDGILDDDVWKNAQEIKNFIQFTPTMGLPEKEHQKTIVKMAYDDKAIYVAAYLYDNPDNIVRQFTSRDNFGVADFFGVVFNPNNDALNDIQFFVMSSGTQADAVASPENGEDFGWNAVWDSQVKLVDDGWVVEMKIPYAALRFPKQEEHIWGIQFHRHFRATREQYSWNPIDRTKGNIGLYHGELRGIKNIDPPVRLSFYPFTSTVLRSFDGETSEDFSVGLDVKYGISENFTLDATLIPDFSQAGFDDVILNLGPFEQQFSEQRQFFKEGVDLFNKGNLFYSRRIGNTPVNYSEVENQLQDNEIVTDNPDKVKMLNAVKVSGRTKGGLGIGVFNAITEKTQATIKDTLSGTTRKYTTEPLANYNILVLDQQFNKNSSVGILNTNVTRNGNFRDANVTALLFNLANKANSYALIGEAKLSAINEAEGFINGFSSRLSFRKISGQYRFGLTHRLADKKYDINDMGILFRNNYNNFSANFSYRIFEPTQRLNNFRINFWANYRQLFKPNTYTGNNIGLNVFAQTKKLNAFGGNLNVAIGKQYDYFEPRTEGRFFVFENFVNANTWVSTNYDKTFAIDANIGGATLFEKGRDYLNYWFGIGPRIRFNNKFITSYNFNYRKENGDRGYVTTNDTDIIFGERDQKTIENTLSGNYNFNPFHTISLSFRNYWATVTYKEDLFVLQENGTLKTDSRYTTNTVEDPNINFSVWNLDLRYSWQFAPGSQLSVLYRNQLFNSNTQSTKTYFSTLKELFNQSFEHTLSVRIVYFIDYNQIKSIFERKS